MPIEFDDRTGFGQRARRRLHDELIGWLVTVTPDGRPQPSPVWFLLDRGELLIYSRPDTPKLRNIAAGPRVAMHLDGDGRGGDVVVLSGVARVTDDPAADGVPAYIEKYRELIDGNGWTAESFAADYSVPVRVDLRRLRGR
jgi:PPOX class probable F420-dependent enzyme